MISLRGFWNILMVITVGTIFGLDVDLVPAVSTPAPAQYEHCLHSTCEYLGWGENKTSVEIKIRFRRSWHGGQKYLEKHHGETLPLNNSISSEPFNGVHTELSLFQPQAVITNNFHMDLTLLRDRADLNSVGLPDYSLRAMGKYSAACSSGCTNCAAERYQSSTSQSSCIAYMAGVYQEFTSQRNCTSCPLGNYCPAGSSVTTPCQGEYYFPTGSSGFNPCSASRVACPVWCYCPASTASAISSCPSGQYSLTSVSECSTCAMGRYQNSATQSSCKLFPPGYYCPSTGYLFLASKASVAPATLSLLSAEEKSFYSRSSQLVGSAIIVVVCVLSLYLRSIMVERITIEQTNEERAVLERLRAQALALKCECVGELGDFTRGAIRSCAKDVGILLSQLVKETQKHCAVVKDTEQTLMKERQKRKNHFAEILLASGQGAYKCNKRNLDTATAVGCCI